MYFRREGWIWKKRYSRLSSTPALSSLDEPAWEPLPAGVSERRRDLPEPRGSVAGGVRGVGGVVAAQVRTSHTPGSSAEVNWRGPEMNDLFWIFFFLKLFVPSPYDWLFIGALWLVWFIAQRRHFPEISEENIRQSCLRLCHILSFRYKISHKNGW